MTLRFRAETGRLAGDMQLGGGKPLPFDSLMAQGDEIAAEGGPTQSRYELRAKMNNGGVVGSFRMGGVDYPFSLRQIPQLAPPANRIEAWRQDLDALEHRFGVADRSFEPDRRRAFVAATAALRRELPKLSDPQIIARMAAAIALSGNAHSRLYLLRNRTELRRMPIRLWWFSDGLYIVRATRAHADLIGCRVRAIQGVSARLARDRVAPAFAGTPGWDDYMSVYSLTSPEMLAGFGIVADMEGIDYRLADCAQAGTVTLTPLPLARSTVAVEAWWDLSPVGPSPPGGDWVQVLDGHAALPAYLAHPDRFFWFEFRPESRMLYVQYNRSADMASETIAQFGERLVAALDSNPVRALVIDLRFNTGGNLDLAEPLMAALERSSRGLQRFLITGRTTFSAGISHAAQWRQEGNVTIVGEPVGDSLDYWSEGGNIILPNSGLAAHFTNGAHFDSPARCPTSDYCSDLNVADLGPDVATTTTYADYRAGRDTAMVAIERRLSASR